MSDNYRGHNQGHYGVHYSRPQGIIFRIGRFELARFAPYVWLTHADYEIGRQLKLDFGSYQAVVRAPAAYPLDRMFDEIARHECSEISENDAGLEIEIIEKAAPEVLPA